MCLLIALTAGADVSDQRLEDAAYNNPDGFGWALHTGQHLIRFRSMDIDEAIAEWRFARKVHPNTPAVWHLRWATHGTVDVSNCHPFEVGHDPRVMLAHNGVLPIDAANGRSDTRILAEDRLKRAEVDWMDDPAKVKVMETWLGGSKLAVLSSHPRSDKHLYIMNESLGHWENGVWWSNHSYLISKAPTVSSATPIDLPTCGMEACESCGTEFLVDYEDEEQRCPACGECIWCGPVCQCWSPKPTHIGYQGALWDETEAL